MTHKNSSSRRSFLTTAAAGAIASGASALPTKTGCAQEQSGDDPLSLTADSNDEGRWRSLFDGKTLDGWHKNPERIGHGTGGQWEVEADGVLAGQQDPPGSGNGGILLTDEQFGDFELSIEMKPDWGVCSGLFIRGNDRGQCFQMMVDYHDNGSVGHIYGEGTGAWAGRPFSIDGVYEDDKLVGLTTNGNRSAEESGLLLSCTPEEWVEAWKLNDWNRAVVRVEGGRYPLITTKINGLLVALFDAGSSTAERYDRERVADQLGDKGSIAVQVHGGNGWPNGAKCRWRNIRVRSVA